MFDNSQNSIFRTIFCTVGAIAVSSTFLFAAAGPAQAQPVKAPVAIESVTVANSANPVAY